jgi:DNA-3-methyladenine glycosylase II
MQLEMTIQGPFSLTNTNQYFGSWATYDADQAALVMPFPVEGWQTSAAVMLRQAGQVVYGEVSLTGSQAEAAWQQALAVLSLDIGAQTWPQVGQRDKVIGALQTRYQYLRPVLFHSPYEAAASFIIGHRLTMRQGRAIRQALAEALGDKVQLGGQQWTAFPRPQVLRGLTAFSSLSAEKIRRLHGIAEAALDGRLDRAYLRSLPIDRALAELRQLDGIGDFFSQGIHFRGAGVVNDLTNDEVTRQAVQLAYHLPEMPTQAEVLHLAEQWQPYRMWAEVLLHVWLRREPGGPRRKPLERPSRHPALPVG